MVRPLSTITIPATKLVMLEDLAGWRMISTLSPHSITTVTSAKFETPLICGGNIVLVVALTILISNNCKVICKNRPYL